MVERMSGEPGRQTTREIIRQIVDGAFAYAAFSTGQRSFSSYHPGGCHFALVDGSVHFISATVDADVLTGLTTRGGGEPVGLP